jgi:hypothetical protein
MMLLKYLWGFLLSVAVRRLVAAGSQFLSILFVIGGLLLGLF